MVNFGNDIEKCLKILNAGGIILYPTDTVWGLGCDASNPIAIDKIYHLKKRPDKKGMIILVTDKKQVLNYVSNPGKKIFEKLKSVTRPTTVIYNDAKNLPSNLVNEDGTIAIRIVQDEFCRSLIRQFKKPIVSTSANISGVPTPKNFTQISKEIKKGVDHIVQHRQDDLKAYEPSSIIKLNMAGEIEIIRG